MQPEQGTALGRAPILRRHRPAVPDRDLVDQRQPEPVVPRGGAFVGAPLATERVEQRRPADMPRTPITVRAPAAGHDRGDAEETVPIRQGCRIGRSCNV